MSIKRIVLWIVAALLLLMVVGLATNFSTIRRTMLGGVKVYETTPPDLPANLPRPAVLVFSKTNGFRHEEAIPAANTMFRQLASERGWGFFQTENGATFNPAMLSRFDVVVFNNVSGDVFTPEQRQALRSFIENGGGFVGVHGSGGDPSYAWSWYVDELIGAQFIGHPMKPQLQQATVRVEDQGHPAMRGLPANWVRTDEWYSFKASSRREGYHILATLDESTYNPKGMFGQELAMGKDHPIAWWHCVGKGKVFYSAMGHKASAYAEPQYRQMLAGALAWAMPGQGSECGQPAAAPTDSER
jgi:type 1 glutamine amidotransferase